MKSRALIFIFLSLSINLLIAQTSCIRLIKKGKFNRAQKKISRYLNRNQNDIVALYSAALLYGNRNYIGYDIYSAYNYLTKSKENFQLISDEKKLKRLQNIPLNGAVYGNQMDTVCLRGLEDAKSFNTVEAYSDYLKKFSLSGSKYISLGIANRDECAFKVAKSKNTPEAYQSFIDEYPGAIQKYEAIELRNQAAFRLAIDENTVNSYEKFIANYPNASQIQQAKSNRDIVAFEAAEKINTVESYQNFIKLYPKAIQVTEAMIKRNELAFNKVRLADDIYQYKEFVKKYPSALQVAEAMKRIHEIAFEMAEKENTAEAYKKFIKDYPNASQYDLARQRFGSLSSQTLEQLLISDNFQIDESYNQLDKLNQEDENSIEEETYVYVSEMPEFPGGTAALYKYISSNINYPETAKEAGISGKCFLRFVINRDGKVGKIEINRGVPGCPECDREAIRVVKNLPEFKSGKNNGQSVPVWFQLPINFTLK